MIGPENVRHTLNQSDAKLKTIAIWSLRFPRFEPLACFYVEFLWADDNVNLYSDRSSGLCWFWFHEICSVRNPQFAFARMKSNRGKFVSNDINLKLEHPKKQILAICYESSFFLSMISRLDLNTSRSFENCFFFPVSDVITKGSNAFFLLVISIL